jgi:uncharacterized protein (DUF2141 family)
MRIIQANMKRPITIGLFFALTICGSLSKATAQGTTPHGFISIKVTGLHSDAGILIVRLFNQADGFPGDINKVMRIYTAPINEKSASITLKDIPVGNYAVSVFHDENNNGTLDTNWIGIPKEDGCFTQPSSAIGAAKIQGCQL